MTHVAKKEDNTLYEQRVSDARMEHQQLFSSLQSLSQMMWTGYGAFFALNTILATGISYSYSDNIKNINHDFLVLFRTLIAILGIFTSVTAIIAACRITNAMEVTSARGKKLEEEVLFARLFHEFHSYSRGFPILTTIGSALFGLLWFIVLIYMLRNR